MLLAPSTAVHCLVPASPNWEHADPNLLQVIPGLWISTSYDPTSKNTYYPFKATACLFLPHRLKDNVKHQFPVTSVLCPQTIAVIIGPLVIGPDEANHKALSAPNDEICSKAIVHLIYYHFPNIFG